MFAAAIAANNISLAQDSSENAKAAAASGFDFSHRTPLLLILEAYCTDSTDKFLEAVKNPDMRGEELMSAVKGWDRKIIAVSKILLGESNSLSGVKTYILNGKSGEMCDKAAEINELNAISVENEIDIKVESLENGLAYDCKVFQYAMGKDGDIRFSKQKILGSANYETLYGFGIPHFFNCELTTDKDGNSAGGKIYVLTISR